jgi:hypothetical protein
MLRASWRGQASSLLLSPPAPSPPPAPPPACKAGATELPREAFLSSY